MRNALIPSLALLAIGSLAAQDGAPPPEVDDQKPVFTGKALPGLMPGTERWIVHFDKAPYSLEAYRAEMWGDRNLAKVGAIVDDIERKMREGRKGFVAGVEALGGVMIDQWWIVNACLIEIAPKQLGAVEKLANVAYLQPDELVVPLIKTATNANNHNSDKVNASGFTGRRVGVAIIDTSFDDDMNNTGKVHITFSNRGSSTANRFCHKGKIGSQPFDMAHPHGTGVASIAAGWKWRSSTADHGHAYDAKFACFSIANSTGGGSSLGNEAAGYNGIAALRGRCSTVSSNLSYSGSSSPLSVEQKAMDSLALNADVVNCTAAGNSRTSVSRSLANVNGLSVGAVNENSHTLATFSSRGFQSGRYFPNISANGVSTNMARQNTETTDYVASGTSMASPQVCGGAALVRDINTSLKSDETIAILLASTKKNAGATSTIKTNGVGAGYMKVDCAADIARNAKRHGRSTLTTSNRVQLRRVTVKRGDRVQCAIKWHRQNVNSTSWANLDLALLRGNTVLVNSNSPLNTEEFVRYDATADETLTLRITLVSLPTGQTSQAYGWACKQDTSGSTVKPGKYELYGTPCGSGTQGGCTVLPKAYATKFGQSANTFPHARANMRYQQVFLASEIGGVKRWNRLCLRLDERFGGPAQAQTIALYLGGTRFTHTNLTNNFAGNYNSGMARTNVFSGTLNLPAHSGGGQLNSFNVCMKFSRTVVWANTANLVVEFINRSRSSRSHFEDFCFTSSDCTTTRTYAFNAAATTGTSTFRTQGLIMCLGEPTTGWTPRLTNTGVPMIGQSFSVNLVGARPNVPAILWMGARRVNIPLPRSIAPGCSLYATLEIFPVLVLNTGSTGNLSVRFNVPKVTGLKCFKFYNQFLTFDRGANPLNLTFTNGGCGEIGG